MKFTLLLLLLCTQFVYGQYNLKKNIPSITAMFVAGMADGLNQTITYNYKDFKRVFPHATNQWWSPQLSFRNKYKNGNPEDGAAYLGSKGILVFTTDGYHFTRMLEHLFIAGSIGLKIGFNEKQKWWVYVIEALEYWAVNRMGMVVVYNGFKIK